ncbi:hypothetical protein D3C73_1346800 [compost metagenome]
MEVDQQLHAVCGRSFADFNSGCQVIVAPAVSVALGIERIIPDPYPDVVDAGLMHRCKNILLVAVFVIEFDAAVLQ